MDDVLDDIDDKLSLLKGTSRSEARQKVIAAISKETSLSEEDKKSLSELIGRLSD